MAIRNGMRAVIYARYSSENQRDASIDDQVEICRRYLTAQGWTLVNVYSDRAISGASRNRAGYQQMIADAERRCFDVIVCEALDRIGRKLSDVADLHDRLQFLRIPLYAVKLGEVTTLHVGLMGTMAQLYLSDLRDKTKRGQLGRALAGKIPGGQAFGYALVDGKTGERRIKPEEALVVERIFRDFAGGKSPRAIAKSLNHEGVPGPGGREWRDTTIRGQPERGTGILNNAIYIGRLEWNRCSYVKDPRNGKRVARPNPQSLWEVVDVPDLRIIDDELWQATRIRLQDGKQQAPSGGNRLNRAHRARSLLAGLLKCGVCGGGYTITGLERYGCATRRAKGTCTNSTTISRHELEGRIFEGLKTRLMAPELVREFVDAFHKEANRAVAQRQQAAEQAAARLGSVERKISALVTAIEDGRYTAAIGDRLAALELQKSTLQAELVVEPAPVVRLHPRLADLYAAKVAQLEQALNDPAVRDEANGILRSLIERVVLMPGGEGEPMQAILHGDLARILAFCEGAAESKKRPAADAGGVSCTSVVAGAGFEPATFRL
jgi:site-specific DNA recombinase